MNDSNSNRKEYEIPRKRKEKKSNILLHHYDTIKEFSHMIALLRLSMIYVFQLIQYYRIHQQLYYFSLKYLRKSTI